MAEDFYSSMAQTARELLAPTSQSGLGQGQITLTRTVPGTIDSAEPWKPVEPQKTVQPLRGAVFGISSKLVGTEMGGTVLLASDRYAIVESPPIQYEAGDTLSVDGVPVHIIAVQRIPAAGVVSAVKFFIRG